MIQECLVFSFKVVILLSCFVIFCVSGVTEGLSANGVEKLSNSSLTMPYGMSLCFVSYNTL